MSELKISCELTFDEDRDLTWQAAKIIQDAIARAVAEALPDTQVRGIWVHRGPRGAQQPTARKKKK